MLSTSALVVGVVNATAAFFVAAWDLIAAEPKLQVLVVGFFALSMLGGGASGRVRRVH